MVGSEEEQIAVLAHLCVEEVEERLHVAVECKENFLVLLAFGEPSTRLVAYGVGRRDAHAEHVGGVALAQLLVLDGSLSHAESECHAVGMHLRVVAFLHSCLAVELVHPVGELVHIVRAGDKACRRLVVPVGGIGCMSGGEDGCAVLQRHAYHSGLEVCRCTQHVADGCSHHVSRRHAAGFRAGAHTCDGGVVGAIDAFAVEVEVVSRDTAGGRHCAGVDAGVSHAGDGGHIVEHLVVAREAFSHQTLHASFTILVVIIIHVVPTHLVDYKTHDEFRTRHLCRRHHGKAAHENGKNDSFHSMSGF